MRNLPPPAPPLVRISICLVCDAMNVGPVVLGRCPNARDGHHRQDEGVARG